MSTAIEEIGKATTIKAVNALAEGGDAEVQAMAEKRINAIRLKNQAKKKPKPAQPPGDDDFVEPVEPALDPTTQGEEDPDADILLDHLDDAPGASWVDDTPGASWVDAAKVETPEDWRPSDLVAMMNSEEYKDHPAVNRPGGPDAQKFLREMGLKNPTRLYRVSARRGKRRVAPQDIEAVDSGEAIQKLCQTLPIKEPHKFTFQAVVLEE